MIKKSDNGGDDNGDDVYCSWRPPDDEHGDHNSDNGDDVYFTCWF